MRLADDLAAVRLLLGDPAVTTVRLVLTPEAVVVAEARRTFTALALYGYALDLVIANRLFPAGGDEWRAGWAAAQQRQLVAIRESFAGLPIREVPYRPAEPVGPDALRDVADSLYGPLPGVDPDRRSARRADCCRWPPTATASSCACRCPWRRRPRWRRPGRATISS